MNVNVAALPNIFEILSHEDYHSNVLKVSNTCIDLHISFCLFMCLSPQYNYIFQGFMIIFKMLTISLFF